MPVNMIVESIRSSQKQYVNKLITNDTVKRLAERNIDLVADTTKAGIQNCEDIVKITFDKLFK